MAMSKIDSGHKGGSVSPPAKTAANRSNARKAWQGFIGPKSNRKAYSAARTKAARDFIQSVKDRPCSDCGGVFHHSAMDFDHIYEGKLYGVCAMTTLSFWTIVDEIAKCEVVCANCHRVRTWNRAHG